MEHLERFELLAHADELHGATCDRLDRERSTAACIAVELRHDDAIQPERLVKRLRNVDGFLSRHGIDDKQDLVRLYRRLDIAQLLHERFVDLQTPRRVDDDDIVRVRCRMTDRGACNGDGILLPLREHGHFDLFADHFELLDRSGTIDVVRDEQRAFALLLEHERELARRCGLTRALEADEHDDGRRVRTDVETALRPAHQRGQFLVDDLDDRLCRRECVEHLLPDGTLLDAFDEVLDDLEVHVCFEECHPHLAHGIIHIVLGQLAMSTQLLENPLQSIGQILKDHSPTSFVSSCDVYCSNSSAMCRTSAHAIGSLSARSSAQIAVSACSCAC